MQEPTFVDDYLISHSSCISPALLVVVHSRFRSLENAERKPGGDQAVYHRGVHIESPVYPCLSMDPGYLVSYRRMRQSLFRSPKLNLSFVGACHSAGCAPASASS